MKAAVIHGPGTVTCDNAGATDTDFFHKAGMEQAKIVAEGKLDIAIVSLFHSPLLLQQKGPQWE